MRITDKYVFFYKDWLSNYQRTSFEYIVHGDNLTFTSTEQAFMYIKAKTFNDNITAAKILATDNPNEARLLGRQVKNYDDRRWGIMRYKVFYDLNMAKYTQDTRLRKMLMSSKFDGKTFVEASPIDRIWGVGLDENNPLIDFKENWRGSNYLGKIITDIRQTFKKKNESDY